MDRSLKSFKDHQGWIKSMQDKSRHVTSMGIRHKQRTKTKNEKIRMSQISQHIHENNGIDHNFNMVLSILNIKNSINTNFSPGYSLVWSNIQKDLFFVGKHKNIF